MRKLSLLLALLPLLCQAQVARNAADDGQWSYDKDLPNWTSPSQHAVTAGWELMIISVHTYDSGTPTWDVRWGGAGGDVVTERGSVGGGGYNRVHVFSLKRSDATTPDASKFLFVGVTGGNGRQTGINVFLTTWNGVDVTTDDGVQEVVTNFNTGTGQTLPLPSAGEFSVGLPGDMLYGAGSAFQAAGVPTVSHNGQTEIAGVNFDNGGDAIFQKAWGSGQGNDLEFGNGDADYPAGVGISIKGLGVSGPSTVILRRRRQ